MRYKEKAIDFIANSMWIGKTVKTFAHDPTSDQKEYDDYVTYTTGLTGLLLSELKNPNKKLSSAWQDAVAGTLDSYLGEKPEKFNYNGKEYTSQEFAESIGINFDDYVEIGSYSHHPFYEEFIIEIPDNWMNDKIYNVPLEDLKNIMKQYKSILKLNKKVFNGLDELFKSDFNFRIDDFSVAEFSKSYTIPGLLVHDKKDLIVPYSSAEKIARNWKTAQLITTEGHGHSLHQKEINEAIGRFMTKIN